MTKKLCEQIWNKLSQEDRIKLLNEINPHRAVVITNLEIHLKWNKLWPCTQDDLQDTNWEGVLGRTL